MNVNKEANGKQMVAEVLESGITPLTLDYQNVVFFGKETSIVRTTLVLNSLDVGTLSFQEYRFVARRTRPGVLMVKRHLEKLLRLIPKFTERYPGIECFTLPVFPRMICDGELTSILYDAFAMYPAVYPSMICVEVSADILYEETQIVKDRLDEIRALGVKVAISEVGDEFCPLYKLTTLPFDLLLLDSFATNLLSTPDADQVAGSLIQYLRSFGVPVIAPELDSEEQIANAKLLECDGYSVAQVATSTDAPEAQPAEEDPAEEAAGEAVAGGDGESTEEPAPAEELNDTEAPKAEEETDENTGEEESDA